MSQPTKKQTKEFNEYEGGNGPRPPVPGKESEAAKMTSEGASNSTSSSSSSRSPDAELSFTARIQKWQESFTCLLADNEGIELLLKFVEEEAGVNSVNYIRLKLYFAVEGLKLQHEEKLIRRLIRRISDEITRGQIEISPELRATITDIVQKKIPPNSNIFDDLQQRLKEIITSTSYQTFLLSEFFINYVQHRSEQNRKSESKPRITAANLASAINNVAVASGSADGAAAFTGPMTVELSPLLLTSSNLQTLHEDAELNISKEPTLTKTTTDRPIPKLTEGLLLATQNRRLEVRPEGAHGYTYKVPFNSSFNPVSRIGSERQSCSSASLTDSEVNSKDGRPYMHRRPVTSEMMHACMNPPLASHKTAVRPLAQASKERSRTPDPVSNSKLKQASTPLNAEELFLRLTALKNNQDEGERLHRQLSDKLSSAQPRVFPPIDDDDQSILDHHVSRVFSPGESTPGNESPRHLHKNHHRSNEMSTSMPDFVAQTQMRHSRSIPEHTAGLVGSSRSRLPNRWPSQNFDSGIDTLYSAYSATAPYRQKPIDQWPNETMRKVPKDESKRTRSKMPLPPNPMPTTFSHHTNSLPRTHDEEKHFTLALCTYEDEKIPFALKIPTVSGRITLKQYKEHIPRKGNFRFFFKTACDDPENPIIQEEVTDDSDLLPLHDGKVCGFVKFIN